jgi:antitoxin Xre/MbcA/ParS-like protein
MANPGFSETSTPYLAVTGRLQTFADESERARLTPAALEAVRNLAVAWKLTGDDAAALLGVSASTWDRIRSGSWKQALSQDQLTRVSALVGIFKALHLLFADGMADRWPRLPNAGPLFGNRDPITAMVDGGIPAMLDVRRYVDALRGGL